MKKIFSYVGIFVLMCFSFYYTDKVAKFMNNEDEVMKSIKEYAKRYDTKCKEGYITADGVVLGVSGIVVNTELSYSEMKGIGFDESLLEYKENPCVVSKNNNKDDYIIRGNEIKNSVSLIINVKNNKNIENIVKISETKNIKLSLMIDYNYLKNNKEYIKELINNGYDILYKGSSEEDLKQFIKELNTISTSLEIFCVCESDNNLKNYCYKNNINTIKTDKVITSSYLSNIKNNVAKGDFIILDESVILKNEIGVVINYIRSRGLKINTITKHLSND